MQKNDRMRFSFKLFLCITPLLIVSFCLIAVLVYSVSAKTVTSISRDKLLAEAKSSAGNIDTVFRICEKDLDTLWQFFFEQSFDTTDAGSYGVNLQKLTPALQKFRNSSSVYLQVGFWNVSGHRIISSDVGRIMQDFLSLRERRLILDMDKTSDTGLMYVKSPVSPVFYSDRHRGYVVTVHKAFYDDFGSLLGSLMIDLDFNQIVELITASHISNSNHGFSFLVDQNGETIFHPDHEPYSTRFTQYRDPVMREFIIDTTLGRAGWRIYKPMNETTENMATYAPIQTAGWTLVKTVPLSEFTQSAVALRTYIIQIAVFILFATIVVLWVLARELNKPILRLVNVTRQMAAGNLDVAEVKVSGTRETAQLTKDFNVMARNLRRIQAELVASEKMVSLGRLSAGVAHELRNPLNAIKLTLLYMERHRLEEDVFSEASNTLYQEIERLNKFVNDFLYFAREAPADIAPCDMEVLINKVLLLSQSQSAAQNVTVMLDTGKNLPLINVDQHQLVQVFLNLYNNAIQAMPAGGQLTITLRDDLDVNGRYGIVVRFSDTGSGISEDILRNIFDPFFTTKESGIGLGLAISRSIAEAHGGSIVIGNRRDAPGVEVTLFIPLENA